MFISYLRVNSVIPRKVSTKREQHTERQGLLEVAYRRHLSEAASRHKSKPRCQNSSSTSKGKRSIADTTQHGKKALYFYLDRELF